MSSFQIGDIVVGNNSWLNGLLGFGLHPGVIIHVGPYSSIVHLFIINEDITLMNEYIDKLSLNMSDEQLKIGDLVELKPEIRNIITVNGIGTIISENIIRTNDLDGEWTNEEIHAFLVYFPEDDYEYTIPKSCLQLFSKIKTD